MKNLVILFVVFAFCFNAFAKESDKDYSDALKLVDVWLEAQKDFEQLPGITAIVLEDQDVLWSGAFGFANAEQKIAAEPSTLFSICSISKLFTSVAIMKLYDEGKLRLDDRVEDVLPSYTLEQKYPESGPITIRSLLTHSSGLPREAAYPYWTGPDFPFPTREQIDRKLAEQETLYPAATYYQYSNLGLALLGQLVEEVSGEPFAEYVQKHILMPLGLTDIRTKLPEELYGMQLAVGYSAQTRKGNREKVQFFQANGIGPAAGFSSNVQDLARFAAWQFRLRDTTVTEILRPSTLKNMQRVHWTDPDWETTRGLGFGVYKGSNGHTWVGHGGSCPGYRSTLQLDLKNKRAFSVMINASGTSPGKYVKGISALLDKAENSDEKKSEDKTKEKKNLQEYTGHFSLLPWWPETYVSEWGEKLVILPLPTDSPADALSFFTHVSADTFQRVRDDGEPGETLVFVRDEDGRIIHYVNHDNYYKKIKR